MKLEDLRGGRVADVALEVDGSAALYPCAFHHHAQQASWHAVNAILRLAGESQDGRVDELIGVVEWWRTVESLISLLHLISLDEHDAGLRGHEHHPTNSADITDKWSSVSRWFTGGTESPPSGLTGLLIELRDFRNSFEHTSRTLERARTHSRLASRPADANLSDLMEAVAICTVVCDWVRFLMPTTDLMPQIWSPSTAGVIFAPLDQVASQVWFPAFRGALMGRQLDSDVAPYTGFGRSSGSAVRMARVTIRHQDEHPLPQVVGNVAVADQVVRWGAQQPRQPSSTTFVLPDYSRA